MARDHFEVLGLARAFHVDTADMESRYLALQKETHPDRFAKAMPDVTLLLAWNLADEIIAQQGEYLRRGGRFLVPIPSPRLLDRP